MKVAGKFVFLSTSFVLIVLHLSLWIQDNQAFSVKKIVVSGAHLLSPAEIVATAKAATHEYIFKANIKDIERRLIQLPQVKKVRVSRILPSSIRIEIEERQPVALIIDNGIWGLDREGVLLPRSQSKPDLDYPVIVGFRLKEHIPGKVVNHAKVAALARFLGDLQATNPIVYNLISEVTLNDFYGVELVTTGNQLPVILGKSQLIKKCSKLEAALNYLLVRKQIKSLRYLDLRFDGQVIARHKA